MSYDPNMDTLYEWARFYPNKPILPRTLWDVIARARFLDFVDTNLIAGAETWKFDPIQRLSFKNNIELKTSTHIYDVLDPVDRFVITAILWSGCIDGAKAIRENMTESQHLQASNKIESKGSDPLYRQGVEVSAVLRKIIRRQSIHSNGIPANSILMGFLEKYQRP